MKSDINNSAVSQAINVLTTGRECVNILSVEQQRYREREIMCKRVKQIIDDYANGFYTDTEAWVKFLTHIPDCVDCRGYIE